MLQMSAALCGGLRPCRIDEDTPHNAGTDGEKVSAVLPFQFTDRRQPKIGLVDQRRGLKRVPGALLPHLVVGQAPQLIVDNGCQPIQGSVIALPPRPEKTGNVC